MHYFQSTFRLISSSTSNLSGIGMLFFMVLGMVSQVSAQSYQAAQVAKKCRASPKVGSPLQEGDASGDYRLVCGITQAKDADCGGECEFGYRCKIQFNDGNGWVNTDTSKGGVHKDVYNAWHQDTGAFAGNNIAWKFTSPDSTDSASNNSSESGTSGILVGCKDFARVTASVSSNTDINPTPQSNPGGAAGEVTLSVTFGLKCSKCKPLVPDTIILDTLTPDSTQYRLMSDAERKPEGMAQALAVFPTASGMHEARFSTSKQTGTYTLLVYDISGRPVLQLQDVVSNNGNNQVQLNTSAFPTGFYIARLHLPNGTVETTRFVLMQ